MTALLLGLLFVQDGDIARAVERLGSANPEERRSAERTVRRYGRKAVPLLLTTLRDSEEETERAVSRLVPALASEAWRERDRAMKGLSTLGRRALPFLRPLVRHKNPEVAWRVRAVIATIEAGREEEIRNERALQVAVIRLLGEAGDPRAIPELARRLRERDLLLRREAALALAENRRHLTQAQAEAASDRVIDFLRESGDPLERGLYIRLLGAFRTPVSAKPLRQLLRDRSEHDVNLKRAAVSALVSIGTPESLCAVIEALESEEVYVRHAAVDRLRAEAANDYGYRPRAERGKNEAAVRAFRRWWEGRFARPWKTE